MFRLSSFSWTLLHLVLKKPLAVKKSTTGVFPVFAPARICPKARQGFFAPSGIRDCKAQNLLFGGWAFLTDRERKNKGLTMKSLFLLPKNRSRNGRIEASISAIFRIEIRSKTLTCAKRDVKTFFCKCFVRCSYRSVDLFLLKRSITCAKRYEKRKKKVARGFPFCENSILSCVPIDPSTFFS